MMKAIATMFMFAFTFLQASAFPIGKIAFRVVAIEERTGRPVKNIPVKAVFTDNPTRWGDDSVERVERRMTDSQGICHFTGTSNHGKACYVVEATKGYYPTPLVTYAATNGIRSIFPVHYRCEPYDCAYTTVMQRVECPIPLYVRQIHLNDRKNGIGGFDGTNAVLRYDFMVGDWLPPHGNGKHADMIIRTSYRLNETIEDLMYEGLTFYDFTNKIEITGDGNGLVEKLFVGINCGLKFREAPDAGYISSKTLRFGRRRKKTDVKGIWPEMYTESNADRCYCFRIRSKFDEKGRMVEAYYGKIYGDIKFEGYDNTGFCSVDFLYYLNPTPLDRNLEWDMKNNLCPNPGRIGQLQP